MRKIIHIVVLDNNTFKPRETIRLKTESGQVEILSVMDREALSQLTELERTSDSGIIDRCNNALVEKGHAPMTDEETAWMLDPMGLRRIEMSISSPEQIRTLTDMLHQGKQ